jgi:hypothetical protein
MKDEPHTDHAGEARELLQLAKTRSLLIAAAAEDAEGLSGDEGDAKARRISQIVIALTRITEMEDRYESRLAGRNASPDVRARTLAALRRDAQRLLDLPDAEFRARYERIRSDAARECENSGGGLSGTRPAPVDGAGA